MPLTCFIPKLDVRHKIGYFERNIFPDSTRRGDAEAGDNNQIQVALVLAREIN